MSTATQEKVKTKKINAAVFGHSNIKVEVEGPESIRELKAGQVRSKHEIIFRIINQRDGDKRLCWDTRNIMEINSIKEMFDQLVAEGFVPYKVDPSGKKTPVVMDVFDPTAGELMMAEIVMAPIRQAVGG